MSCANKKSYKSKDGYQHRCILGIINFKSVWKIKKYSLKCVKYQRIIK